VDGKKATKFQAFLGTADSVKLSWKPRTQAAEELEPVVIAEQFQHIHVAEALISYDIRSTLDIRRRGLDAFTLQLPADYRVISVDGANIAKWDLPTSQPAAPQVLAVKLFRAGQGQVHADGENGAVLQGAQRAVAVDARADSAGASRNGADRADARFRRGRWSSATSRTSRAWTWAFAG